MRITQQIGGVRSVAAAERWFPVHDDGLAGGQPRRVAGTDAVRSPARSGCQYAARAASSSRSAISRRQLLAEAQCRAGCAAARGASLAAAYDANEKKLAELTTQLDAKAGNLGEMFGVVRQVANDFSSVVHNSLISAQFPDREDFIVRLSQAKSLPSMPDLERFWFELQREMTESGRVVRFQSKIVTPEGTPADASVVRVGPFNATSVGTLPVLSTEPEAARGHAAPARLGVHVHRGSGREGHRGLRGRIARSDARCAAHRSTRSGRT